MAEDRITSALRGPQQGQFELPPDHVPGMAVPKGGSSCAKCKYLGGDGDDCTNQYFIEWNGSPEIPGDINAYCSDWFEPSENEMPIDKGTEVSEGAKI